VKYCFYAQMLTEMKPSAARKARHPVLCSIWSALTWVLAPLAYFGLLIASLVLLGTLFKAVHCLRLTGQQHWSFVGVAALAVAWFVQRVIRRICHAFRQDVIDVDGIIGLIGVVLGLAVSLWLFPPR